MGTTRFYLPTKIIFGAGSLARLGAEAAKIGRQAILVTGTASLRRTGVLDRAVRDLNASGVSVTVFDRIEPNPRVATVDEGARVARQEKADLVIGIGGGSAMDAAKAIALASSGTGPAWSYIDGGAAVEGAVPALVLVPTVAASGSEANNNAVVTNEANHEKRVLHSNHLFARVSIVDPELTLTLPPRPTAQGGVDIFCHLVEEYITDPEPGELSDAIMEAAMKMAVTALPRALARPEDIGARTSLSWASTIACSQFTALGGGGGTMTLHGMEHPLSGYYDIAHGDGLAALLPAWMRYTLPATGDRFNRLGTLVFGEADGLPATEGWLDRVGMRPRLKQLGVEAERLGELAENAVRTASWLERHPRPLNADVITQLYQESY